MQMSYAPLRTLQDVEELERVPLDQRVFSWDLNDWIARGCMLDPDKIAIRYIADGNPDLEPTLLRYSELQSRAIQAANLFYSLGVSADDVVMYVLPTLPQLYVAMLGAVRAGIACGVNWMLKPELLAELVRATRPKAIVTLGPTPGYEIWENPGSRSWTSTSTATSTSCSSRARRPACSARRITSEAGAALEPGAAAAILLYENRWARPFVAAVGRSGAQLVASGRISAGDLVGAAEALETTNA